MRERRRGHRRNQIDERLPIHIGTVYRDHHDVGGLGDPIHQVGVGERSDVVGHAVDGISGRAGSAVRGDLMAAANGLCGDVTTGVPGASENGDVRTHTGCNRTVVRSYSGGSEALHHAVGHPSDMTGRVGLRTLR